MDQGHVAGAELTTVRRALAAAHDPDAVRRPLAEWVTARYLAADTPAKLEQLADDLDRLEWDPGIIRAVRRIADRRRRDFEPVQASIRGSGALHLGLILTGIIGISTGWLLGPPAAAVGAMVLLAILGVLGAACGVCLVGLSRVRSGLRLGWQVDAARVGPELERTTRALRTATTWAVHAAPRSTMPAAIVRPRARTSRAAARRAQGPRSGSDPPGEGNPERPAPPALIARTTRPAYRLRPTNAEAGA